MSDSEPQEFAARSRPAHEVSKGELLSKVPRVTAFFWIIKVLCTTVGETASDFLNVNLGLGLKGTSVAAGTCLLLVLLVQLRAKKYVPAVYWLAVVLISVFGTLITDVLTDSLHVPLEISSVLFTIALGLTFAAWYRNEGTLSIHSIFTRRRELFYWLAILFTFALGTATGDLMAEKLGLGYLVTGLIVLGVIACAGVAWRLGLNAVLAFWIAYILTRPLGASLGDYLSQPKAEGGVGLGATVTSVVFLTAILVVVVCLALTRHDAVIEAERRPRTMTGQRALWQVSGAVVLLLALGVTGYFLRRSQLQQQAATSVSADRPLGDLSRFRTIALDMKDLLGAGNTAAAKSKADDLETAWDRGQAQMKAMNQGKWTLMDDAIDDVLKHTRASVPSFAAGGEALDALLAIIDSLDRPK